MRRIAFSMLLTLVIGWAVVAWSQEADVLAVVQKYEKAYNADDLNGMAATFADEATIDSKTVGRKVSKPEWKQITQDTIAKHNIVSAQFKDLKVTMTDPTHAVVAGTVNVVAMNGRRAYLHEWKLEQRNGQWLIVETNYKN